MTEFNLPGSRFVARIQAEERSYVVRLYDAWQFHQDKAQGKEPTHELSLRDEKDMRLLARILNHAADEMNIRRGAGETP